MRCLGRAVRTVAQRATGADSRRTAPQCALPGARRGARRRAAPPVLSASRWQSELEELAAERAGDSPPPPVRATTKGFGAPRVKRAALEVQLYPNPCLRAPNADVTAFDAQLAQLTRDMFAVMYATDGVGLAAPQVGVNQRLMVYNPEGVPGRGVEVVLCNPVLEESSEKEDLFEEGCLSFPEIYADVRRPLGVTVSYQDVKGEARRLKLDGFQARIFQHEFDHLQGVLFQDRMSPEVLATVQPQLEALERAWAAAQRKTRR